VVLLKSAPAPTAAFLSPVLFEKRRRADGRVGGLNDHVGSEIFGHDQYRPGGVTSALCRSETVAAVDVNSAQVQLRVTGTVRLAVRSRPSERTAR